MLVPFLLVAALAAPSTHTFQDKPSKPSADAEKGPGVVAMPDLGLTLDLSFLEKLAPDPDAKPPARGWTAAFAGSELRLQFGTIDLAKNRFHEPEDVVEGVRDATFEAAEPDYLAFEPVRAVRGPFGAAPILAIARADVEGTEKGELFLMGSLLDKVGWYLSADLSPPLAPEARARLTKSLEGCAKWSGKPRDPKWTDAEAKAYFDALAPAEARKKYEKPLRTDHFIVLSAHSSANQFGKKLETWYAEIKKVLPFEEAKDRRLMPVLLFRHDEEFKDFYATYANVKSRADVDFESWCGGDWYATHFDNDSEYDNRMELTKFLLINRMRAWGANNWFRNGLREYCATRANERDAAIRAAKKNRATPLDKLFDDKAWGARLRRMDKTGVDHEADYWEQSAVWIEFLRESKESKAKFPAFVLAIAGVADGDVDRVKSTLKSVFGWDVPELEKRWMEHCKTRK